MAASIPHPGRRRAGSIPRQFGLAVGGLALSAGLLNCSPPAQPDAPACGDRKGELQAVALTAGGDLVCIDDGRSGTTTPIGSITGLGDEVLVGIDVRVPFTDADGVDNGVDEHGTLYGLGDGGGIFSIDTRTAAATREAQLDVELEGTAFDIDFNPTVDRLRVVSDSGQNLRVNVSTGEAIVDGALNVAGAPATGVVGAAYTNNDTDPATGTTLYDINAETNGLFVQNPPNDGGLVAIGSLGVDTGPTVGFDLYSRTEEVSPGVRSTVDVVGWATLDVGGSTKLYRITPFSGRAVALSSLDADVVDIAFPLEQRP